jgi:aldose 1-epimerase
MRMKKSIFFFLIIGGFLFCTAPPKKTAQINKAAFGISEDGATVDQYTLINQSGMEVKILTYGGIITNLFIPDVTGKKTDVVLGFDELKLYESSSPYFGALIGRYGNRIAGGKFNLEGEEYTLVQNNGTNHLHGGTKGFDKVIWEASAHIENEEAFLELTYLSKDQEEGYPGNLAVEVTYVLTRNNSLEVRYKAQTDKTTVLNLTQHTYFNLSGDEDILNHELKLNASSYLPVDETLIPLGTLAEIANTPFDFTTLKRIGSDIDEENLQLKRGLGYDHCWVLNNQNTGVRTAAVLKHPRSGIQMEVLTDLPGIQFYSGNFLDGTLPRKGTDSFYAYRSGLCLETQFFPNAPNEPSFPSPVLKPGEVFQSTTVFQF